MLETSRMKSLKTGSTMPFGGYNWRVLDVKDRTALIITEDIIEARPYHNKYIPITWAECELREYLNGEFYNKFTETERARMIPIKNKTPNNPWYGTNGGADTRDRIFLLSIEETACKYSGDSSSNLLNPSKKQRYWFQRKDENNSKRIANL